WRPLTDPSLSLRHIIDLTRSLLAANVRKEQNLVTCKSSYRHDHLHQNSSILAMQYYRVSNGGTMIIGEEKSQADVICQFRSIQEKGRWFNYKNGGV
nr:hypothetical protein [Tanacetum cinerariifolium]